MRPYTTTTPCLQSPILYLFDNADLIEHYNQHTDAMSTEYTDDMVILAWGKTTERTCEILGTILHEGPQSEMRVKVDYT